RAVADQHDHQYVVGFHPGLQRREGPRHAFFRGGSRAGAVFRECDDMIAGYAELSTKRCLQRRNPLLLALRDLLAAGNARHDQHVAVLSRGRGGRRCADDRGRQNGGAKKESPHLTSFRSRSCARGYPGATSMAASASFLACVVSFNAIYASARSQCTAAASMAPAATAARNSRAANAASLACIFKRPSFV